MRRSTGLDPIVAKDLEQLDAVLAGEGRDPDLELIADVTRADAPPMPPGLELRLESAIAEGFPRAARKRAGWLRMPPLAPALGTLAAVALAVVVATSALDGGAGTEDTGSQVESLTRSPGSSPAAAVDSAGGGASLAAPTTAPEVQDTDILQRVAPGPRRVKREADLTLSTPIGKLQETSDAVGATADRLGGHVASSEVSAAGKRGQATFDLRIPTSRLDEALATLARLGHVRSRSQETDDITARFTSARARLQDARAERQALLRALAEATTSQEIDSINARLEIARSRIDAAKGDLFGARRTASMARVGVTVLGVAGEDEGAGNGKDDGWTPGKALEDAIDLLSVAAGVAIVAIAGAIPAALLALLVLLAWRVHRRRSRELALESHAPAV